MLSKDFLLEFRRTTEARWRNGTIDPKIYGFQFQACTTWNPGLHEDEIRAYEDSLGFRFPDDFRALIQVMNGTGLPTLNIHGSSRETHTYSVGVYSYPDDLESVKEEINRLKVDVDLRVLKATLAEEGFVLADDAKFVPIYAHRSVVCTSDRGSSAVISIWDENDAIIYGQSLEDYLIAEFLPKSR